MDYPVLSASEYLLTPTDINVHRVTLEHASDLHRHDFVELAFIASGKGMHEIGGALSSVMRGDVFLIRAGTLHRFISDEKYSLLIYNCIFLPDLLKRELSSGEHFIQMAYQYLFTSFSLQESQSSYLHLHDSGTAVVSILDELYDERCEEADGYRQMMKASLHRLLITLFRLSRNDARITQDSTVYPKLVVENAIAYMRNRCHTDLRCEDIARHTYVSPSYLSRMFKQVTGKTVIAVLQDIRIEKACLLLRESRFSVSKIAADCGYADIKFFYSLFVRLVGMTPGAYRDAYNQTKEWQDESKRQ